MRGWSLRAMLVAGAVCLAACGGGDGSGSGSGPGGQGGSAPAGEFGAVCAAAADCNAPYTCFEFGMGQKLCTKACASAGDCSPESDACNGMGYCKVP